MIYDARHILLLIGAIFFFIGYTNIGLGFVTLAFVGNGLL